MKLKPRKPNIDKNKHISYSKAAKKYLLGVLSKKYGDEKGLKIFEDAISIFEEMCRNDMPFIGGKRNMMGQMAYDSIMCAACYEAEPIKPTLEEFDSIVLEVSFGKRGKKQMPEWFNGDNKFVMSILTFVYKALVRIAHKRFIKGEQGEYWDVKVNVSPTPEGIQVLTFRCPIYEVMKKRGLLHLMPAMCNPDYENFAVKNFVLIRPKIVSMGDDVCDMRVVGKNSMLAKICPSYVNDKGFLINDIPEEYAYHSSNDSDIKD